MRGAAEDSVGRSYHLSATEDAIHLESFIERLIKLYNLERSVGGKAPLPRTRVLNRWQWWLYRAGMSLLGKRDLLLSLRRFDLYRPYLQTQKRFDDTVTREALKGSGIRRPAVGSYLDRILAYALKTNFGRQRPRPMPGVFTCSGNCCA